MTRCLTYFVLTVLDGCQEGHLACTKPAERSSFAAQPASQTLSVFEQPAKRQHVSQFGLFQCFDVVGSLIDVASKFLLHRWAEILFWRNRSQPGATVCVCLCVIHLCLLRFRTLSTWREVGCCWPTSVSRSVHHRGTDTLLYLWLTSSWHQHECNELQSVWGLYALISQKRHVRTSRYSWPWLGPPLPTIQYVMCFWFCVCRRDDAMFYIMEQIHTHACSLLCSKLFTVTRQVSLLNCVYRGKVC